MKYTIIDTEQSLTITTKVEYTFDDGTSEIIEIFHFNPIDFDVLDNIQNRYESEYLKKEIEKSKDSE